MKKLLLSLFFGASALGTSQVTLFQENWDGQGPGYEEWLKYDVDGRTPVAADTPGGGALSALVIDAWTLLLLEEIQIATPGYAYPAGATGMAEAIVASNSWYDPVGIANDWIVSPPITIPAGAVGVNLSWAATSLGSATFLEDYQVYVSPTAGDQVADFTSLLLDVNNELNTGNFRTQSLNAFIGQTIRIAFRNDGNDQYVMFLDNISVTAQSLSADEFLSNSFSMFPNPAENIVKLTNTKNILVNQVSVVDINGRTVSSSNFDGLTEASFDVSNLNSGVYFVNIDTDQGVAVKKLVRK